MTERNESAWEGGGNPNTRPDGRNAAATSGSWAGHENHSAIPDRKDIPGGRLQPAHTPGALGPTTRDIGEVAAGDADDSLMGRIALAHQLMARARRAGEPQSE